LIDPRSVFRRPDEVMRDKFKAIKLTYDFLLEHIWLPQGLAGVTLNHTILNDVVRLYWEDLSRFKEFHQIKRAEEPKQASFSLKWIIKLRPVVFSGISNKSATRNCLLLNEVLGLTVALQVLKIPAKTISPETYEATLYTLRHGSFEEDHFLLWCDLLWRLQSMKVPLHKLL
jgi:hypothetical protein